MTRRPADQGIAEVGQGGNGGERGTQDEASTEDDVELREHGRLVGSWGRQKSRTRYERETELATWVGEKQTLACGPETTSNIVQVGEREVIEYLPVWIADVRMLMERNRSEAAMVR